MKTTYSQFLFASALLVSLSPAGRAFAVDKIDLSIEDARREGQISASYALNPYLRDNALQVSVKNGQAILQGKVDEKIAKELAGEIAMQVPGVTKIDNQILVEADYIPSYLPDSFGSKVDDASITAAIHSKLQWNKDIDSVGTEVTTRQGRVTLSGSADNQAAKNLAGRLSANTRGVSSVTNNLQIRDLPISDDEKENLKAVNGGHRVSDPWITAKVKSSFMFSSNINGSDIAVTTRNGIVTLSGTVANSSERVMAIETALHVRGVKNVLSDKLIF